jgi:hypothetical protein
MKRQRLPALGACDFIEVDARSIFVSPVIWIASREGGAANCVKNGSGFRSTE